MARLRLTLLGLAGNISVDAFVKSVRESLTILQELDRALSHERTGTLQWVVSGLNSGSTVVELESRVFRGDEDISKSVISYFTSGIRQIQYEAVTPPFFSIDSMRRVRNIVRLIGRDGVEGYNVLSFDPLEEAELTRESEKTVESLVGVHHRSLGAVEGRLELISLHYPSRRFNVYHAITNKAIRCNLPKELEQQVIDNLGQRVIVSGVVAYNVRGEPISVQIEGLRTLLQEQELPSIEDILGVAPDITDDLPTEEHIRRLRDG